MHSLRGHHGAKSTDVYGKLIGRDVGADIILALWAPSGSYEAESVSPCCTSLRPVGNGAARVHQTSSAQFVERPLGPSSDPNLFDSALSASAASMDVDVTEKGSRGL